jgi:uncharacterized membrane protein
MQKSTSKLPEDFWYALIIWTGGMVIGALVAFPNHYYFRTSYDLGIAAGMFENIAKGEIIGTTYWANEVPRISIAAYLLGFPFYWLGGVWGVITYQWFMIGFAAWGLYLFARETNGKWGWLAMAHFFGMWGVYTALGYDVHIDLLGPCLIPWIFYTLNRKRLLPFILVIIIAFFSKETMPIIGLFLFITTFIYYYSDPQKRKLSYYGFALAVLAFIADMLIISWAETKLGSPSKPQLVYRYLWSDNPLNPSYYPTKLPEIVKQLIKNIPYLWIFLWESPTPGIEYVGIKSELHFSALITGGWAFFAVPVLLIGALPIYFYKLYSDIMYTWGTLFHYNMEFATYIPISMILWVSKDPRAPRFLVYLSVVILSHILNLYLTENRFSKWYERDSHAWYSCKHYDSPYQYKEVMRGLAMIPETAYVSAVMHLLPHLKPNPGRHFLFPSVSHTETGPKADYLAFLRGDYNVWPLGHSEYQLCLDSLSKSPYWETIYDKGGLLILRRR